MDWRKQKRQRDGSIRTIGGYLYARIQYIDENTGRRKEKLRRATSRKHARELLKQMRAELDICGQETLEADKITFRELAERYEGIHLVAATYRDGVKVAGKRSIGPSKASLKPVVEYFATKTIRSIKPSDLEAYKTARLNTPVEIAVNKRIFDEKSEKWIILREFDDVALKYKNVKEVRSSPRRISSVNRELELIRAIFNFAKSENILIRSPFDNKSKLIATSAETQRDRILGTDEEERLIAACGERRSHLRPLVVVAVDTAMRRGELFKLRWRDVDLEKRTITILASNAKTEKARTVGLTSRSASELHKIWENSGRDKEDLVFGISSTVKNAWKSACEAASLTDLRFHDLRHTATTRLVRSGVPATEVMKITGHTQFKTFMRYLNLTSEAVSSSVELLENYLNNRRRP